MPYVITGSCSGVKSGDCVAVCPVECIHPAPDSPEFESAEQLYIDPVECIDCSACVDECPAGAIFRDDELDGDASVALNAAYFAQA